MSLPYFPMYPSDFEAKTSHLTLAEDGAYNRLLRICWMSPGCSMPADEAWIMRRARAQTEEEQQAVRNVLQEFFTISKQCYSNARLKREWIAANEAHEKRKKAGSKGGKTKSLKNKDSGPGNAKAMLKQPEPEPEPEPDKEEAGLGCASARETENPSDGMDEKPADPPPSKPADLTERELILRAMGYEPSNGFGMTANGGMIGTMADMREYQAWRDDLDLTFDEIHQTITEITARRKGQRPPVKFKFFTDAMKDLAGLKKQAPLQPNDAPAPRTNGRGSRHERAEQHHRSDAAFRETIRRVESGEIDLGSGYSSPFGD